MYRTYEVASVLDELCSGQQIPKLLRGQKGRIMDTNYTDELLPHGFGFQLENELNSQLFLEYADIAGGIRSALFALCNRFGVICGPASSEISIGSIWQVPLS